MKVTPLLGLGLIRAKRYGRACFIYTGLERNNVVSSLRRLTIAYEDPAGPAALHFDMMRTHKGFKSRIQCKQERERKRTKEKKIRQKDKELKKQRARGIDNR
jgi:hypothetical protein